MKLLLLLLITQNNYTGENLGKYEQQLRLELLEESSGYTFTIPIEVYQNVYKPDLSDMRIINATGDIVPMRVYLERDAINHEYTETSLPTFKLNQSISVPINTKQVRTTTEGTFEDYTVATSKSLHQYLETKEIQNEKTVIIDASILEGQNIVSLTIDWQYQTKGNRIFRVNLAGSNDLSQWSIIKHQQKLLEINTGSKTLLENIIKLNGHSYAYFKLTFTDNTVPEVRRVSAQLMSKKIKHNQQSMDIQNFSINENNQIIIDTGGYFPIEYFSFSFNQKNTISDVKLYSRQNHKQKWRHAGFGTIYAVNSSNINNIQDVVKVKQSKHRYWKIQLDDNIGAQSLTRIKMAWRKHQVEFLAQGNAPFTLVYANQKMVAPVVSSWYNKLPKKLRKQMFSKKVSLNTVTKADSVKQSNIIKSSTHDYRKWLFWLILSIVILVLSFMAYKLIGEANQE